MNARMPPPPADRETPSGGRMEVTGPADEVLTASGLRDVRGGRILLLACGALAREILALRDANGWDHMDLLCLPASLHLHPERIPDAVEEAVARHRDAYQTVFVVYADCGTGGLLQARCKALGVEMVPGPHCYAFFEGVEDFSARADVEMRAFYLTDFLVRQFDAFVWRPFGLDRHPDLRDTYFGQYDRLIYQAQTEDPQLDARARDCAVRLGLTYERRFTGYGDLQRVLARHGGDDASAPPGQGLNAASSRLPVG